MNIFPHKLSNLQYDYSYNYSYNTIIAIHDIKIYINKVNNGKNSTCWCTCTGDTAPGVEGGGDMIPDPADIWW